MFGLTFFLHLSMLHFCAACCCQLGCKWINGIFLVLNCGSEPVDDGTESFGIVGVSGALIWLSCSWFIVVIVIMSLKPLRFCHLGHFGDAGGAVIATLLGNYFIESHFNSANIVLKFGPGLRFPVLSSHSMTELTMSYICWMVAGLIDVLLTGICHFAPHRISFWACRSSFQVWVFCPTRVWEKIHFLLIGRCPSSWYECEDGWPCRALCMVWVQWWAIFKALS